MRVLFFGDGPWGALCLERIAASHEIVGVVLRQKPTTTELGELTDSLGLQSFCPARVNDDEFVAAMRELAPDVAISMSYDQIFRQAMIELAPKGLLNCHAGKLPHYRGRSVLNWVLINGELEIGLTVHLVDDGIDTGPIVLQKTMPIGRTDDYGSLLDRVARAFPALLAEALERLDDPSFEPTPQEGLGTYYPERGPGDEWIDWAWPSERIYNKIRALADPGPGARTTLGDASVTIWEARHDRSWPHYTATPGRVVGREPNGVRVKTGDSTIVLVKIDEGSGRSTPKHRIGTRFGFDPMAEVSRLRQRVAELESRLEESP